MNATWLILEMLQEAAWITVSSFSSLLKNHRLWCYCNSALSSPGSSHADGRLMWTVLCRRSVPLSKLVDLLWFTQHLPTCANTHTLLISAAFRMQAGDYFSLLWCFPLSIVCLATKEDFLQSVSGNVPALVVFVASFSLFFLFIYLFFIFSKARSGQNSLAGNVFPSSLSPLPSCSSSLHPLLLHLSNPMRPPTGANSLMLNWAGAERWQPFTLTSFDPFCSALRTSPRGEAVAVVLRHFAAREISLHNCRTWKPHKWCEWVNPRSQMWSLVPAIFDLVSRPRIFF